MNRPAIVALTLILALGATAADAARHKHHRGKHVGHPAGNSFATDAKRGDITIDRKGNIVAPPH